VGDGGASGCGGRRRRGLPPGGGGEGRGGDGGPSGGIERGDGGGVVGFEELQQEGTREEVDGGWGFRGGGEKGGVSY